MARPVKLRCIGQLPNAALFKPAGIPVSALQAVKLSVEEAEAIRLKDLEELDQKECAKRMRVSRPTFHRILESGRKKLADALINGKAIQIEGGNFSLPQSRFRCNNDGHEWNVPFEVLASKAPLSCPVCFSPNTQPTPLPPFGFGWRQGKRCRRGKW